MYNCKELEKENLNNITVVVCECFDEYSMTIRYKFGTKKKIKYGDYIALAEDYKELCNRIEQIKSE